jgi:hypothetical protein
LLCTWDCQVGGILITTNLSFFLYLFNYRFTRTSDDSGVQTETPSDLAAAHHRQPFLLTLQQQPEDDVMGFISARPGIMDADGAMQTASMITCLR